MNENKLFKKYWFNYICPKCDSLVSEFKSLKDENNSYHYYQCYYCHEIFNEKLQTNTTLISQSRTKKFKEQNEKNYLE